MRRAFVALGLAKALPSIPLRGVRLFAVRIFSIDATLLFLSTLHHSSPFFLHFDHESNIFALSPGKILAVQ